MNSESTLHKVFERIKSAGERGLDDQTLGELVGISRSQAGKLRRLLVNRGLVKRAPTLRRAANGYLVTVWVWTGIELD
jgi:hypothetical protein